jgi:hypothetical protein
MADDKKKDDKKSLKAGDFTIEISEKKEKPPKKEEPLPAWKIIITLLITLGISFQLIDDEDLREPSVVVRREDRIEDVVVIPDPTTSDPTTPDTTVQQLELKTIGSVETLHTRIRQALITQDHEAIAPFITNGYYWIGDTYAPLNVAVLTETESPVMTSLERAIAAGCVSYKVLELTPAYWVCPGAIDAIPLEQFAASTTVLINGDQVNIRQLPSLDSEVITTVSYTTVLLNQPAVAAFSEADRAALATASGWCPVILSDGQSGYVSSQFCRPITQAHALFRNVEGQWQMTVVTP